MTFRFYIGGYFNGHFEVVLQEDDLCFFVSDYSRHTDPEYVISTKNDKDWRSLVEYMKTLNWKERYSDNDIMDGLQWELAFESEDKKLNCFGSNEYPADFDEFTKRLSLITRKHKIPFNG